MRRAVLLSTLALAVAATAGAQTSQTLNGLELTVASVERASNVSLTDCPPGQNIVRGVIKPGDKREFASVTVNVTVTPAFEPGMLPRPVLHDETGNTYNTAQSFADIGAAKTFSCTFAFRVPKGARLARLTFDNVSLDVSSAKQ